ncbi:hypothetical protein HPP92_006793 [Vanilla planifolia]|uniref:F-box domain-containing protein n=1 Tax=Vanilla planifolia TaxID=51239 RepID=A0A835RL44_VANPL|nr:hypothetical protein HPP92_006793 [Vanilla planifolia]
MEAPTSTTAENRDCFKRTTAIDSNTGIMDERVLLLVFTQLNFDPHVLSVAARVSRRLRAVVSRVLWRHACISRAPRLVSALTAGFPSGANRVCGGWHALAKLLFYCAGCEPSSRFPLPTAFLATSSESPDSPRHLAVVSPPILGRPPLR